MAQAIELRCNACEFKLLDADLGMPAPIGYLWCIVDVRFGHLQDWPLELILEREARRLRLVFRGVVSFRAQDESEILSHWAQRSAEQIDVGSVYQIGKSTYLDEFSTSMSAIIELKICHYLIAGHDLCVEILSTSLPEVILDASQ